MPSSCRLRLRVQVLVVRHLNVGRQVRSVRTRLDGLSDGDLLLAVFASNRLLALAVEAIARLELLLRP